MTTTITIMIMMMIEITIMIITMYNNICYYYYYLYYSYWDLGRTGQRHSLPREGGRSRPPESMVTTLTSASNPTAQGRQGSVKPWSVSYLVVAPRTKMPPLDLLKHSDQQTCKQMIEGIFFWTLLISSLTYERSA